MSKKQKRIGNGNKTISKIKELAYKNNQQDIVGISDKFLSKFSLFDKKS